MLLWKKWANLLSLEKLSRLSGIILSLTGTEQRIKLQYNYISAGNMDHLQLRH